MIYTRDLQSILFVLVKSRFQPARIRVLKPKINEIMLAIDEARKRNAHGFVRSDGCERTRQFKRFPIVPNKRINIDRYRFDCFESSFNSKTTESSLNIADM